MLRKLHGRKLAVCLLGGAMYALFAAFGWQAETIDGHDMQQILDALERARSWQAGPYCIVAKTVKGKGVSYMENNVAYHSSGISGELYERAVLDLQKEEC